MKEIKYKCEAEETSEQKTARAICVHMRSASNPDHDKDTSDNRICDAETLNRVLAQRDRIKRTTKKGKPDKAKQGDIAVAQYQDGYHERKERGK